MSANNRIVFLYTEMAGYFLACVDELASRGNEVHVIHWPVNKEAPFNFDSRSHITFYDRATVADPGALVNKIGPNLIICSGWIDKAYVAVCRAWFGKVPTVLTSDNHWTGSLKQQIARIASPFTLQRIFSNAWVPGTPQQVYVGKLGFGPKKTRTGFYSADYQLFAKQYEARKQTQQATVPHRFAYVGRYLEFKGIFELWNAFIRLRKEGCDWELHCFGTGALWDQRIEHDGIEHHGFVQPAMLPGLLAKTGVFVLPSHKEPWGVVVHEMAAAGFPMLCSDAIGASTRFLEGGKNGHTFTAGSEDALYQAMKSIVAQSDEQLIAMGNHSASLGGSITPTTWAEAAESFLEA